MNIKTSEFVQRHGVSVKTRYIGAVVGQQYRSVFATIETI